MATDPSTPRVPSSVFASRRRFIEFGAAAVGAAWAGTMLQARLFPQAGTEEVRPVSFTLADLPVGGARPITYAGSPAIVLRTPESIRAFSLVCTHLGCQVDWLSGQNEFHCPCHDGRFDQFGEVLAGPPPLPLEQLPVKVDGDTVVIGEA